VSSVWFRLKEEKDMARLYMVVYEDLKGVKHDYNAFPLGRKDAMRYLRLFRSRFVGKPYPNGKGFYDYRNVRLVEVEV
jgi:hypothetical protein